MDKYIYCCGVNQPCKIYDLPVNFGSWKRLYFLDECAVCKQSVAIIKICDANGKIKTLKRCAGNKAVKLRDKLTLKVPIFPNISKGSLDNERLFYNNFGIIYNFNNRRVGTNEEFCSKKK